MQVICHKLQMFNSGLRSRRMLKMSTKTFFQIFSKLKKEEVDREQGKAFLNKTAKKGQPLHPTIQTKCRTNIITNTMKMRFVKTITLAYSRLLNFIISLLKNINISTKRIFHLSPKFL
jgi:hypothetical protein